MSSDTFWPILRTFLLLFISNCFMTTAWYGHLKFKSAPLWIAILVSWGLAFFEYVLQVPANRLGYGAMNAYQLKILQECITLIVFMIFASLFLGEGITLKYGISFALVLAAVAVAFYKG
ncbi:MAG: DMT family protein [Bdellovibrionia bacterium]